VLVRGPVGSGKTTLRLLLERRARHLISCRLLESVMDSSWDYPSFDDLWHKVSVHGRDPVAVVRERATAVTTQVVEPGGFFGDLAEGLRAIAGVEHVFLVVPDFMLAARQRSRFLALATATVDDVEQLKEYQDMRRQGPMSIDDVMAACPDWVETTLVDATDLPLRELSLREAREVLVPDAAPCRPHTDPRAAAQSEVELDHCQVTPRGFRNVDVLVVGGHYAPLATHAITHQARSVTLIEQNAASFRALRRWRTSERLPITLACLDPAQAALPPLHCFGRLRPYSVGFVDMPSSWDGRVRALLRSVFAGCASVVLTPQSSCGPEPHLPALQEAVLALARREGLRPPVVGGGPDRARTAGLRLARTNGQQPRV